MKRLFDLVLVLGSAPFWLPLLLVLAVLVRVRVGVPVFFLQVGPRPLLMEYLPRNFFSKLKRFFDFFSVFVAPAWTNCRSC